LAPPAGGEDKSWNGGGSGGPSSALPPSAPGREPAKATALDSSNWIALAAVAGAHGIKGEVRLKLFTDSIDNLKQHDELYVGGVRRRLIELRQSGQTPVARFDGICDRNAAEALRGILVEVDRSTLPPLGEDEYYHADLIGLPAVDQDGKSVGTVVSVENFGAGDLLEIEHPTGKKSLIPYRDGIADLEGGRIVVDVEFLA
jgi:16S rRNA processing protein RimM